MSEGSWSLAPAGVALEVQQREEHWRHFDNSVNAVSFGFVATAILISMFLVMAIFERFLRPRSPDLSASGGRSFVADPEAQMVRPFSGKLGSPSSNVYTKGVSVLMPGQDIPTFIAHPAPAPCHPERVFWPLHHHNPFSNSTSQPSGG